jgi:hypothetical protein
LDYYHKTGNAKDALAIFEDVWADPDKIGAGIETWPPGTSFNAFRTRGVTLVRSYTDSFDWGKREVLASEHKFLVPFGEHQLKGIVDLVDVRTSGTGTKMLRIVDLKTAGTAPNRNLLSLNIQFTIYLYASYQPEFWEGDPTVGLDGIHGGALTYERVQELPRRGIWWHLRGPKEIDAGGRVQADYDRLYRLCEQVSRAIENEVFVPRIGEGCNWCPYTEPCGLTVPTKEELNADTQRWL